MESLREGDPSAVGAKYSAAEAELARKREDLLLARARVVHQLEASANERYRTQLGSALADLEQRIAHLDGR